GDGGGVDPGGAGGDRALGRGAPPLGARGGRGLRAAQGGRQAAGPRPPDRVAPSPTRPPASDPGHPRTAERAPNRGFAAGGWTVCNRLSGGGQCEPGPGGPRRTTLSLAVRKSSWPRWRTSVFCTERWKEKSNSSSVLRAGKRACLIRLSPPCASREATSVCKSSSAKRSYDHSSALARSASFGSARAAAGAFSARNRKASSAEVVTRGSTGH